MSQHNDKKPTKLYILDIKSYNLVKKSNNTVNLCYKQSQLSDKKVTKM